ncbi:unnamed protein product [Clonostachys rosea f. rosea IK726]|uniref:Uncharacterized protein n=1 Tax=Clonostachys rosea f. rosea IK726 TaxID=1349383 RepID=A0ACA9TQ62_BIOOC|nr:unnamed protein product [Clonostachys rosea f. rosea IK726]
MKVLLTGGTGFVAAHSYRHNVVVTVRSVAKGQSILAKYHDLPNERLSYTVVEDIAVSHAFDDAVRSDPPLDAVIHTASPFHYNVTDPKKDLLDPAIIGTTGILESIKRYAPTVRRVVITSSFASMIIPAAHPRIYDETVWNSVTLDEATKDATTAYRASKTFAERAAWDFILKERPSFTISTINPPSIFGPIADYAGIATTINTSNERFRDMIQGNMQDGLAPTGAFLWVDVRDVAEAHAKAMETEEAANKRFFIVQGHFTNADIANIIKQEFTDRAAKLPENPLSDMPNDVYGYDNSQSKVVLGLQYRPLRQCVIDSVNALLEKGL